MGAQIPPPDQWGPEQFRGMTFRIEDLELLRSALGHLKEMHKLSWAEIERQADVSVRRIERFVTQRRRPIDHHDLHKMAEWVASMIGSRTSPLTRALKSAVTITYDEVRRVWKAYAGDWICVSVAEASGYFYCMELNISAAPENHDAEDFPLPKFVLQLGSDEIIDDGEDPIPHHWGDISSSETRSSILWANRSGSLEGGSVSSSLRIILSVIAVSSCPVGGCYPHLIARRQNPGGLRQAASRQIASVQCR
jgi:hypothetical protein